jgi:hypothetical protein
MLAWIMVGSLFLVFAVMIKEVFSSIEDEEDIIVPSAVILSIYVVLLMTTFIVSMGVDVARAESMY